MCCMCCMYVAIDLPIMISTRIITNHNNSSIPSMYIVMTVIRTTVVKV